MIARARPKGLAALIGSSAKGRFFAQYFQRRTYYRRGAVAAPLLTSMSVGAFRKAAPNLRHGDLRAYARNAGGTAQEILIRPDQMDELFWAGMTIVGFNFDRVHPPLSALLQTIRRELQFSGEMSTSVFFSPPDSGYALHYDAYSVFSIQLQGTKKWLFERAPSNCNPPFHLKAHDVASVRATHPWFRPISPRRRELRAALLKPGDLLYLAPGTWHEAAAGSTSLSMSINLDPTSRSRALSDRLDAFLSRDEDWRRPADFDFDAVTDGRRPPRARPTRLETQVLALAQQLEGALAGDTSPPDDPAVARQPTGRNPITRSTLLQVVHPFRYTFVDGGHDELEVVTADRAFTVSAQTLPFIERIAERETLFVGEIEGWLRNGQSTWKNAAGLVSEFMTLGLLRKGRQASKR